jgi:hypothetical protein
MKTTTIGAIQAVAAHRKPGYADEVLRVAQRDGDRLTLTDDDWQRIAREYRLDSPPTMRGLGDVIARATSAVVAAPEQRAAWEARRKAAQERREKIAKLPKPSFAEKLSNLATALTEWAGAGFPVADAATIDLRRTTCGACAEWTGLTCRRCGCTALKWWLATAKCPAGKWLQAKSNG